MITHPKNHVNPSIPQKFHTQPRTSQSDYRTRQLKQSGNHPLEGVPPVVNRALLAAALPLKL
jgi:hypothetical protein